MSSKNGVVLGAWDSRGSLPDYAKLAAANHRAYAEKWGYEYILYRLDGPLAADTDAGPAELDNSWLKVQALLSVVAQKAPDFIFYLDMDSLFADFDRSLSDLASAGKPIVVTGDSWDVFNGGHVFIRPGPASLEFIEDWWSLRLRCFPPIAGTQDTLGLVNDQVAMNYLMAGGTTSPSDVSIRGASLFNKMNGFEKNLDRRYKNFSHIFAPVSRRGALMARLLLGARARRLVGIVPQNRLNAYPVKLPGSLYPRRPGLWHFPGQWKSLMTQATIFR